MIDKSGLAVFIYYAYYGVSKSIIEQDEVMSRIMSYLNLPENTNKRISDLIINWRYCDQNKLRTSTRVNN